MEILRQLEERKDISNTKGAPQAKSDTVNQSPETTKPCSHDTIVTHQEK